MRVLHLLVTAFCLHGTTATGTQAGPGTVAVDPRLIPFGSTLRIPGYGTGVARDTGGGIKGRHIDVWLASCGAARQWGARWLRVSITRPA